MNWKRWLGILIVAAAVAGAIALGFRKQPVMTEFVQVSRGALRVTVDEEGKTRVVDRYVVSAPVAGYMERLRLKVGDAVARGQVIGWLEPPRAQVLDARTRAEQEARVEASVAALRSAEERARAAAADETYWNSQVQRTKKLLETGDISREAYERALSEGRRISATRRSAEYGVEQARSELEAARAALRVSAATPGNGAPAERVPISSPVGGRVLKLIRESEGAVTSGEPLLELGNARALEVEVEVLSADAVRIAPGMRVLFERWGGDQPLEGRVRRIEPVAFTKVSALGVEEQRVLVLVTLTSPEEMWRRLGDRYRVEASFILWESDGVLQVPASALFRHEGGWAVFAAEGGLAVRRKVELGHRNGRVAEIRSGLQPGETVIVHPDDSISEGTAVQRR